ncbi:uncharacterized protein [Cicer arietinum]|nr:uncharacterized protein LOC101513161 isoform X2 [Cicer arietinum]
MEENMEFVHIADVPDTPDRSNAGNNDVPDTPDRSNAGNNDRKCVGNLEKREKGFPVTDEISNCSNYIILSPDKPYPSQKGPIFRRAQTEKVFGLGTSRSSGAEKMEKGKTISSKIPSMSSHHGHISVFDLTEESGQFQQPKSAFSHCGSRDNTIEDKKELKASIGSSSTSGRPHPSQNAPIFRRAQTEKVFGFGTSHSKVEKMEKGKTVSSKIPPKSSHGRIPVLDLTEESGKFQQPKPALSHCGSRDNMIEDKKELKASIGNSTLPLITDSSNTSRDAFTGKCKLDDKTLPGPNIFMDRGKSISLFNDSQSQSKAEKHVSLPSRLSTAPIGRGHKRLVRNGCISPQNIATRAKQSAEQSSLQTNNVAQIRAGHSVSSNTTSQISVGDIVAEERGSGRVKGKGVLVHPSSHGTNAGAIHTDSSPAINYEEASGTSNNSRNSFENWERQGGWRNYNVGRFINRQNINRPDRSYTESSQSGHGVPGSLSHHTPQPASLINPEVGQSTTPHPTADSLTKRQRKRESSSRNSSEASHSSKTIIGNSSGEASCSSWNRVLDPELDELFTIPSFTNGLNEGLNDIGNNSSDARARQLEADEILARELQEQLYHDFEGSGMDEHLAWQLQHAGDLLHTSIDSHEIPHPARIPRENRQPRSRPHQDPSNRRRTVPQVPHTNRISQLRSRMTTRSSRPAISSRGRRPRFPLDMDLDMRLDILEALEDAVGDFNDMGMADDILNAHRDFNEDDYEMLLALDDHNHQHTGASVNQINSLPQSTIQTDNFIEDCAICLETPAKGEIIRHLPCLHKFHKDCIDPWLGRKKSCPVCKSSIT